jgi:putative PIN family toxin of toxin-antitoxin system
MTSGVTTKRLRAVLDTNVIISAYKSTHATSASRETVERWENDEFTLLISAALRAEYAEHLVKQRVSSHRIVELLANLQLYAEWVDVPDNEVLRVLPDDADDDHVLACARLGNADYILTYDPHFEPLNWEYEGIPIVRPAPFLRVLRGPEPLEES